MNEIFKIKKASYYISKNVFFKNVTPKRTVESWELEFYTTTGNISVINDNKYEQKAGNILVAMPGDIRNSIGSFECRCVHFICNDSQIVGILKQLPKVFEVSKADEAESLFKKLSEGEKIGKSTKKMYMQGCLLELISILTSEKNKSYDGKYKIYASSVAKACDFMKKNYSLAIKLSDVAKSVHLSPTFFHKVFKDIKNITPHDYLTSLRIKKAKEMLSESDFSLSEIAYLCGFESQSYFNYVFKAKTLQTPKSYRDKNRIII